jgi:enediyne biosynthesis protein E4
MSHPVRGFRSPQTAAGMLLVLSFSAHAQGIATGNAPAISKPEFSGLPFNARFTDVSLEAGLTRKIVNGRPGKKKYIVEANGTGVAFVDYDNDGLSDIFLVNGTQFEPFPKGQQPTNYLYRNAGAGKFEDVTLKSGIGRAGWGNGVCAGDVDNDGNTDLFVTYWGSNSLFRNEGDGTFEDTAAAAGVASPKEEWSTGCTFLDYDRDGHLDLFVSSYVSFDLKKTPSPGQFPYCMYKDRPVFCGPRGLPHGTLTLYRNRGDATFEDQTQRANIRESSPCYAFTTIAADLNGDGWTDIYVACDSTPGLYFRNNRDGTFSELATEAGIAYNEHGAEQAGMGVAVADLNGDGWLDLTKTNFIRDYPNLYRNLGKGLFEDAALASGLGVNPQHVLWGTGLEDFDNDGWRDVFQASGHVFTDVPGEPWAGPRLVYRNLRNGKFEDVSHLAGEAVTSKHSSRGAAFGDFDNDGDVDVLVMNMGEPPSLLRNDLRSDRSWIQLRLQGTASNRSAIGATVTVHAGGRTQTASVLSQSSYLSANDPRLHFGLDEAASVDRVVVRWPSGASEEFTGLQRNSMNMLIEGKGQK